MIKKSSVMTKGQVYILLTDLAQNIRNHKTVKEVNKYMDDVVVQYIPQSRGRRTTIDTTTLQAIVDEVAPTVEGKGAKHLACMVSSKWNMRPENVDRPIESQTVKRLVATNKLVFPAGFVFTSRPRKPKTVEQAQTTV